MHHGVNQGARRGRQRDRNARARGQFQRAVSVTRKTKSGHPVKRDGYLRIALSYLVGSAAKENLYVISARP